MFQALHDDSINEPSCDDSTGTSLVAIAERARAGDNSAFAALFQYYNGQICTYLARLVGNDEIGRDLAQETFIRAWKSLPQTQGELHFRSWLYRIATNTAISHLRRERLIRWLPWPRNAAPACYCKLW